ncbi:hypothetical protein GWI33_011532 [Rhynchophorus ferrugineus]|uniref:Uncharacterized protein n=1 Tax=Rhynchophorus ferrugineus TaxID=354439 RepID=A0A834MJ60_RHYFE|nr:hypothetical protein GWI33_011532 [Rhynchophorus ferrugineus]
MIFRNHLQIGDCSSSGNRSPDPTAPFASRYVRDYPIQVSSTMYESNPASLIAFNLICFADGEHRKRVFSTILQLSTGMRIRWLFGRNDHPKQHPSTDVDNVSFMVRQMMILIKLRLSGQSIIDPVNDLFF